MILNTFRKIIKAINITLEGNSLPLVGYFNDVEIRYSNSGVVYIAGACITGLKPFIIVDDEYFICPKYLRAGILAHEYGHVLDIKRCQERLSTNKDARHQLEKDGYDELEVSADQYVIQRYGITYYYKLIDWLGSTCTTPNIIDILNRRRKAAIRYSYQ